MLRPHLLLILSAAVASGACHTARVGTARNPAIVVLPGALAVKTSDTAHGQVTTYQLAEPYPADRAIADIQGRLRELGWRPRERSLLNPDTTYSDSARWKRVEDGNGEMWGWTEEWQNGAGEVVLYSFGYRTEAAGQPAPTVPLEVFIAFFDSRAVRELEQRKESTGADSRPSGVPKEAGPVDQRSVQEGRDVRLFASVAIVILQAGAMSWMYAIRIGGDAWAQSDAVLFAVPMVVAATLHFVVLRRIFLQSFLGRVFTVLSAFTLSVLGTVLAMGLSLNRWGS